MDNNTENTKDRPNNYPTSQRQCAVCGKRFKVVRHFEGGKTLSAILIEIAVNRANREMGFR